MAAPPDSTRTVFISYRREVSQGIASMVFRALRENNYDAYLDTESIDGGDDFEQRILEEIGARAHFVVILEPGSLDRVTETGDWLRREIAQAIETDRNIIPVTRDVSFGPGLRLPNDIKRLPRYHAIDLSYAYIDPMLDRLYKALERPAPTVTPTPPATRAAVSRRIDQAVARHPSSLVPLLSGRSVKGGARLSWSRVAAASEYTLERAFDRAFSAAEVVYRGPLDQHSDALSRADDCHYRVQARSFLMGTPWPWSDPVVVRLSRE